LATDSSSAAFSKLELNLLGGLQGEVEVRVAVVMETVRERVVVERVKGVVERVRGRVVVERVKVGAGRVKGVVLGMEVEAKGVAEKGEAERVKAVVEMVVEEKEVTGEGEVMGWVGAVSPMQEVEVAGCSGVNIMQAKDSISMPQSSSEPVPMYHQ
jgi:hypothetical protein